MECYPTTALSLTNASPPVAEAEVWWRMPGVERAFGGQIIAHCLIATARIAPSGWHCHSCHLHFLRAGRLLKTRYEATKVRVGRTYATYRVVAVEDDGTREVACAVISFHDRVSEDSKGAPMLHTEPMPVIPRVSPYLDAMQSDSWPGCIPIDDSGLRWYILWRQDLAGPLDSTVAHVAALGFLSDMRFIWAAHAAHRASHAIRMVASLDHALHIHDSDFDATAPLLYEMDSPWAASGRGLVRGRVWEKSTGKLIASTVQEGVLRVEEAPRHKHHARL